MKKVFLLVMLVAGILFGAEAQNRSINFEQTKVWKQIVKKAKKEKKRSTAYLLLVGVGLIAVAAVFLIFYYNV